MLWLLIIVPLVASYSLARIAAPDTLGAAMSLVMGATVVLGACWRAFERLLWVRYRTKQEYTVAARCTCWAMLGLLVIQAGFVAIGA